MASLRLLFIDVTSGLQLSCMIIVYPFQIGGTFSWLY